MNRTKAREQAFLMLFQYKFRPDETATILEDFFAENKAGAQKQYIENVVLGAIEKIDEIDKILSVYTKDWQVDRLSSVSLALLRLAVYEMKYMDDIPSAVSVNEAVALAKEYEGEEAVPFVNGILGKIKNEIG